MTDTFTPNLKLTKTQYNTRQWQDKVNSNFSIIDAIVGNFTSISGIVGVWLTSTAYLEGNVVIDPDVGTLWKCLVPHTSAVSGTFLEDRLARPSNWEPYNKAAAFRGEWQANTAYNFNDFIVKTDLGIGRYAIALTSHTSSSDFDDDLAQGKWAVLIDGNLYILPTLAGAGDSDKVLMSDPTGTSYVLTSLTTLASMLGFPASGIFSSRVVANTGVTAPITPPVGTVFQGISPTNAHAISLLDAFGTNGNTKFVGRRARGTASVPTAVQANDVLNEFNVSARGATAFFEDNVRMRFNAAENWTDSARGTYGSIASTAPSSTTPANVMFWFGEFITALELAPWTTAAIAVSAGSGTITSVSGSIRYIKLGKLVIYSAVIAITTNGTGATDLRFVLPHNGVAGATQSAGSGRETAINSKGVIGTIFASFENLVIISNAGDGTYPGVNGANIIVGGTYQAA